MGRVGNLDNFLQTKDGKLCLDYEIERLKGFAKICRYYA